MIQVTNNDHNLQVYYARGYDASGVVEYKGGTTLAFYVQPEGNKHTVVMYGLARCHNNDGFSKKTGRELAVVRLTEAPSFIKTDFPSSFLISKTTDAGTNYRLPSSKVILTMFANIIIEHYAQELQNKAFSMIEDYNYNDVRLDEPQILDVDHAKEIMREGAGHIIKSFGSGASDHDLV